MRAIAVSVCLSFILLSPSFAHPLAQEYHMLDTEEAFTIGQGNFRTDVEFGVTKQPDASELYNIPRFRLIYGLSEWADIEFEYDYLILRDGDFVDFSSGVRKESYDEEGTGDLRIKVKVVPCEFGIHRLGIQGIAKLPMAEQDKGLGTNETDFTWQILFSSDWGLLKTHLNAGFAVIGDPSRNGNQNDSLVWGVGGEYALTDSLTLMAEIEGSTDAEQSTVGSTESVAESSEGDARARVRLALTGPIGAWRWGASGFKGVNGHTEDWGVQVGMSKTWGLGGPTDQATPPAREKGKAAVKSYYNPLKTEEAYTIGERNFRSELGFGYVNQPDDSDLYIMPDVVLGWGIGPWADLEVGVQYLFVEDTATFDADGSVLNDDIDKDGIGDVRVKVKLSPFGCRYGRLGLHLVTKVPSADDDHALGTDETDFIAKGLFSTDWHQVFGNSLLGRLKTHVNAGVAVQSDRRQVGAQQDYLVWGVAGEYGVTRVLTLWAEVEGATNGRNTRNISEGDFGNAHAEARLGLTGPMPHIGFLHDWKWGASASVGLNNHSRDWTANLGFSHTWGE